MIQAVLTIDDMPSRNTPAIVDTLCERGIRAVMFAVGENLAALPAEARYALQKGMIVGNHSDTHPHFSELTAEEGMREIARCEARLDEVYKSAGVARTFRPFRFPYGDKGGANKAALQRYLRDQGFDKLDDRMIPYPFWRDQGLDKDIDTLWTFNFCEYMIRPGSNFTAEDVLRRIHDADPAEGAPLLREGGRHILLLHAHDETEALVPGYCTAFLDELLSAGVTFAEPAFIARHVTLSPSNDCGFCGVAP